MNANSLDNQLAHIPAALRARKDLDIRSGDTVRVHVKIKEGKDKAGNDKFRIQVFEGLVLARKHGREPGATFTVRKISNGFGVERVFPLYSPNIETIEVIRRSNAGRSKLYYIRTRVSRDIRRKIRNWIGFLATTSKDLEVEEEPVVEEVAEEVTEAPVVENTTEAPVEEVQAEETPAQEETKEEAPAEEKSEEGAE